MKRMAAPAQLARLNVVYLGWGESWPLGTLAQVDGRMLFEYSAQAIERGLEFSPLRVPLPRPGAAPSAYSGPRHFHGLPGFIADSLPDGWGMLLMDRALRKAGRDPQGASMLERLAIVGHSAMGALGFEPADPLAAEPPGALNVKALAREIQAVVDDDAERSSAEHLRYLLMLGGSPQGARPKALLRWQRTNDAFRADGAGPGAGEPWLLKFPAQGEHPEVCALETFYARLARAGGIDMPEAAHFALGAGHAAFGVRRFDRVAMGDGEVRVPMLSLAALLDADYRLPALDYETVLLATARITGDYRETLKAFERCVFNVLTHNRDDHAKNFAYLMDAQGRWRLAPAFDLSYSQGPGGQHSTSVAGEGARPSRADLMRVAKGGGVKEKDARDRIDHWLNALRQPQPPLLHGLPVRQRTLDAVRKTLTEVWRGF